MANRPRRASLKDVAELANTSIATASRALSGKGYVAKRTSARVLEAAKKLNYQPDLRARSLRRRSSQGIGLIIPNLLNAYYTELADSITKLLADRDYHLMLSSTRDDPEDEKDMVYGMVGQAVDGLIWVPTNPSKELLANLVGMHSNTVVIVRRVPDDVLDTVVFADYSGSYAAVQHMIDLGHRRIGYIGGDLEYSSNDDRWRAFIGAMQAADIPIDESLVRLGTISASWGFLAANDLIRLPSMPTAIYVASNAIVPGVLKCLRQQKIRIPQDLSLICFDDVDWFSFSIPPITCVKVGHNVLAETAINLLMRRIHEAEDVERPPDFVEIPTELVLRGSTAPPRSTALDVRPGARERA
jgi:DNA-binding LacI/PurR family transcriptional regulator